MKSRRITQSERRRTPDATTVVHVNPPSETGTSSDSSRAQEIRILIVDGSPIFLDGVRSLLDAQPDFDVVGAAIDPDAARRLASELQPDVVLFDAAMPDMSEQTIRDLAAAARRTVVLTTSISKPDILRMLQLGVSGVVLKQSPSELLHKSIRTVHAGDLWISRDTVRDIAHALVAFEKGERIPAHKQFRLSDREREVLRLLVTGNTNKNIAEQLWIREDTVKHHVSSIFDKTGASNRLELTLFAIHHRLVADM